MWDVGRTGQELCRQNEKCTRAANSSQSFYWNGPGYVVPNWIIGMRADMNT